MKSMSRIVSFSFVASVMMFTATFSMSVFAGDPIPKEKMPKAVLEAFAKAHPNETIIEYATKDIEGVNYYELEWMVGKLKHEEFYNADGTLFLKAAYVEIADLPSGVKDGIERDYPGKAIIKVMKMMRDTTTGKITKYKPFIEGVDVSGRIFYTVSGKKSNSFRF